jgi:N-acetyl-gamma-glutamyl-phosphate reductase
MNTIRAGIAGAAGFSGLELFKLLARHPQVEITFITSEQFAGRPVSDFLIGQRGGFDPLFEPIEPERQAGQADVVFLALPPESSLEYAGAFLEKTRVIDLSAAFRIPDPNVYEKWYRHPHTAQDILPQAVYGLSEWNRDAVRDARLVANPGCYPTSALLPMLPLAHKGYVREGRVLIDAKSGVSGMGRKNTPEATFMQIDANFRAYGVGVHRHTPEISGEINLAAAYPLEVIFTPHLLPVPRGILSTIYFESDRSAEECREFLRVYYEGEPFVRVLENGLPDIAGVAHTNLCVCTVVPSNAAGTLIAVSAIDNLMKGAAGQAVQNMNICFGFQEELALF